jgi:hypothetical protein
MVFIECPSQNVMMFENQLFNASQVVRPHAPVAGQADGRRQPKLTLTLGRPNVNVRWLLSLIRVKVKPE